MPRPEMYFVINCSEDGLYIEGLTKSELTEHLNEKYWGENVKFSDTIPEASDPNEWGRQTFIIKGTIVVPKEVKTVTQYEV